MLKSGLRSFLRATESLSVKGCKVFGKFYEIVGWHSEKVIDFGERKEEEKIKLPQFQIPNKGSVIYIEKRFGLSNPSLDLHSYFNEAYKYPWTRTFRY